MGHRPAPLFAKLVETLTGLDVPETEVADLISQGQSLAVGGECNGNHRLGMIKRRPFVARRCVPEQD